MSEETGYSVAPEGYFNLGARLNPRTGQPYDTTMVSKGFHIELRGSPITDKEDIEYIRHIFSARDPDANCARFVLSGPEGGRPAADSHQHGVVQLKSPKRVRYQHILTLPSGKKTMVYAVALTEYSQATGDIENLLDYIKKHDTEIIYDTQNQELLRQSEQDNKKGRMERIWSEALQQYPMEAALKTLKLMGPRQYSKEVKDFGLQWQKKWNRQVWLDATFKENLKPWHDDGSITEIQEWVRRNSPNKVRGGNLFIVGPSKTGKSEYIIQEVCRKYNSYYIKGKFDWTNYNNEENYKFYVFDDVMYDKEALEGIKALTSGINIPTNINVKYSMAFVKCRPCIHILNDHEYEKFRRMAFNHGGMAWWGKNSRTVFVTKPLFKLDSEILQEKMDLENTMSENSVEIEDDDTQVEEQDKQHPVEHEDDEENEEQEDEENPEKTPKLYTRQKKHSFRSRFKHALRYTGMEEDDVQELMQKFDERRLKKLREKEKIEYGFEDEDDDENNQSVQEEQAFEQLDDLRKHADFVEDEPDHPDRRQLDDYEEDEYEEEDNPDLPPSTRYYNTGRPAPDGIIYDRFN